MVIPVVFLLLVVVSPTAAITLDTDGGIGGGGDGGLGLGFIGEAKWTNQRNWQHRVHKMKTNKPKTQRNMHWIPLFANKHK
jgi:hypothetical protein